MVHYKYAKKGSPWEFNLRDVFRWCDLLKNHAGSLPKDWIDTLYLQRMRTKLDRDHICELYRRCFDEQLQINTHPLYHITPESVQVGQPTH